MLQSISSSSILCWGRIYYNEFFLHDRPCQQGVDF